MDNANDSEIADLIGIMKKFMTPVRLHTNGNVIDMCGTGGDKLGTFNISTAATFVAAAAGAKIAKHGNRSSSGGLGSADIFEMLGVNINDTDVSKMLEMYNLCFLFAQRYHPAVRHVAGAPAPAEQADPYSTRWAPCAIAANVQRQLIGVSDQAMLYRIPRIMRKCDSVCIMSVMSENGLDEMSVTSPNKICLYKDGSDTTTLHISARDLSIPESPLRDIIPNTRQESLEYFVGRHKR